MELTIVSRPAGAQREVESHPSRSYPPKSMLNILALLRVNWARRAYEQGKFQMMWRNLTNPLFDRHL